ncbi:TPA: DNA repair protein RadA [Streptococcus suis]|uniref:DNA repair protein RadA n=1 Tax=Streptococcus suis TaxID=1307 RepID=A0A6L8MWB7_STRSU|nr:MULTISPECIES: DNA repair protein RadA [Streptococcus]MBL6583800.1 DNA repair protein RadA [Streptococcus suis]MBM7285438.1 DNA repair protein RadA [Streptococcus suis]MBS8039127.1 DNA repair protein RadA [Streptococcus suis]MBS8051183.1 DNA repair protein RadA [Streptococcus suis]MBS8067817.1 DNA repair protein RadA [Streptococcus suis]
MIIAKKKTTFVCQSCEYHSPKYLGRCPNCGSWSSFVEEVEVTEVKNERVSLTGEKTRPMKLNEVSSIQVARTKTNMEEFNRVLGGGVVPGSLVLIGGDPGIGKSTLLLQVSTQLSTIGTVLYVSGEESAQQIKLRAERLGDIDSEFYLYAETNMQSIRTEIEKIKPDFLIIDSIQTIMSPDISSVQGSVSQVREVTNELMQIAKTNNIATFIVGHMTKEGTLAGPRTLEHMVDTVLYFEGERQHTFRILRAVKNRFGSTNEIGIFEMQSQGLVEVLNPSEVFLEERLDGATGSAIVVTMEGTRPILAEVQALVTPTMFGNAKRTTTGLDFNRASLIMAVLEKRAGLLLQNQDAYLKSAGGVKLDEPAIDLAVAVALASSYKDKPTNPQECFIGEIGLTGEIRRVNRIEQRINEAAKLGFTKVYAPKNSLTGIKVPKEITVIGVTTIGEVLQKVFN